MRRLFIGVLTVGAMVMTAWPAAADDGPAARPFESFSMAAQAQAGSGTLFGIGSEVDRVAGARTEVTLPENVYAVGAVFQRGVAAGYTYGAVLGTSGAGGYGVAPEPPPGEADALFPAGPLDGKWQGAVTSHANGEVIDGASYAKASGTPNGESGVSLQKINVADQLKIDHVAVSTRGGPSADGVETEAVSVLGGITIGSAVKIEHMVSRAFGSIPAAVGDAKVIGTTVVDGATVNGVPVNITQNGIDVADQHQGADQKAQLEAQVAKSLADAHIREIKLAQAVATQSQDKNSVEADAGELRVIYQNPQVGGANPQGFSGGGFEVGGATITLTAQRAGASSSASTDTSQAAGGPSAAPAGAEQSPRTDVSSVASGPQTGAQTTSGDAGIASRDAEAIPVSASSRKDESTAEPLVSYPTAGPVTEPVAGVTVVTTAAGSGSEVSAAMTSPRQAVKRIEATLAGNSRDERRTASRMGLAYLGLAGLPLVLLAASLASRKVLIR